MIPVQWSLIAVLLVVAWLTAGGMAVRSVSRIWLRHWAERRLRGSAAALTYLSRPQRLLTASAAGIATALVYAGAALATAWTGISLLGALIGFAILINVFAQIVPRALARRWPSALAPVALPVLHVGALLATPIAVLGRWIARPWLPPGGDAQREPNRDAVQDLLREGEMEGVGEREEIAIISGVVDFSDKRVADVMTRRADIFSLDESMSPRELALQIAHARYSRVPIHRGSVDHIVGMVHAFDVLKAGGEEFPRIRSVRFAAPDDPCNELLFRMLRERMHLAIVREGTGKTAGLVTLEDLLEELVGEIHDEHDEHDQHDAPRGVAPK